MFRLTNDAILLRKVSGVLTACRRGGTAAVIAVHRAPTLLGTLGAFLLVLLPVFVVLGLFALALSSEPAAGGSLLGVGFVGETVSTALTEQRQQFYAKQKELAEALELAKDGNTYDLSRKPVLEKLGAVDSKDAVAKIKQRNVELDDLGQKLQKAELDQVKSAIGEREAAMNTPVRGGVQHPIGDNGEQKSFGQLFAESKAYLEHIRQTKQPGVPVTIDIGLKTLFQTTAGFPPESVRSGRIVEKATRPIQIIDLIPMGPIGQATEKYMEETTRTHAAAETAEGIAYPESTFVFVEKTSEVRKIGDSIPVTDEQLEDEAQVAGLLDQRLRFGVMQRLDGQVLNGTGVAPNLRGLLNVVGIQTQPKGTDPVFDAVYKAMTLIRFTGRAVPSGMIFHPNDWQTVRLTRTADGLYIMGNPSEPGPMSLFGLPVALGDAGAAGTSVIADFLNFTRIGERRGVEVQVGYVGTQFTEGKKTLRADVRACFTVYRPAAVCTVTGL